MPLEMISLEHKTEVLCNEYPISSIPNYIHYPQTKTRYSYFYFLNSSDTSVVHHNVDP